MAENTEMCKCSMEERIVTQIMVGMRDEEARHELLKERNSLHYKEPLKIVKLLKRLKT